ncbi:DEAD/DEAH box helicase [Lichenibacterium minor]|uniref:DEAD-box ATP-dependent RNA helicase RhpA n=1 Tax=Lichenibacterium minor TaxID=2316528 RepID=A0A4Q2U6N6_9HYPH|nr:DEAD/DEAH box helicase [Lichenibacterium minor]RYC31538.1 DEAD/DEAH box helicase [Lichenibacterium minor]
MNFNELGLSDKVLQAVEATGYTTPTPIQEQAIPIALAGRDVLGIAQTGTGKTAAFTLPMLSRLETGRARARMPRTLILEPTRELAAQVEEAFVRYGVNHKVSVALLIGGVSFADQEAKITRGADVLIATPGRLLDFAERGKLLLTGIEILVIDEADRMLDMGFIPDIEKICKLVPFTRQTLFFSATMPPEITRLTEAFLHNPARIEVARPSSTAASVAQSLVASAPGPAKREVLRKLLRAAEDLTNAIIFSNRKRDVALLTKSLEKHGFSVGCLHGDMDQRSRMTSLDAFRNNKVSLLVCSDVAARGLDIPMVSHVYNFDVPTHAEDYVHRIGRTGRAGRSGTAISIVTKADQRYVDDIEKLIQKKIDWQGVTLDQVVDAEPDVEGEVDEGRTPGDRRSRRSQGRGGEGRSASPARGSARGGEARGRGEGRRDAAEAAPVAASSAGPTLAAPPSPSPRRAEPAQPPRSRDERPAGRGTEQRRHRHDEDDEVVIGLGDHVPSFLLRPVRIKASTDA